MIVPVDVPLVTAGQPAQTDASGNFTSTTMVHPANWSAVRLVAQTSGNPRWILSSDNGLPLDFATSPLASMGLVLVAPGQRLTTQILAALPSASVLGHLVGVMGPDLNEVLPFYLPSPNTIGSTISGTESDLGQVSDTNGAATTKTLVLPAGAIALQILPGSSVAGSAPLGLTIRGTKSRDTYFFVSSTSSGLATDPYYVIAPQSSFEPQLDITVTAHAAQTDFVEIIALTLPVAQATIITGVGTSGIPSGGQDVSSNAASSIPVVPAKFYQPALWQAPLSVLNVAVGLNQVGAGDTAVIIPGVAGQVVRLWDIPLSIDTPVATGAVQLETVGGVATIHQYGVGVAVPNPFRGNGVPLAVGAGVQLRNLMAANPANMRGSVVFTQA